MEKPLLPAAISDYVAIRRGKPSPIWRVLRARLLGRAPKLCFDRAGTRHR